MILDVAFQIDGEEEIPHLSPATTAMGLAMNSDTAPIFQNKEQGLYPG